MFHTSEFVVQLKSPVTPQEIPCTAPLVASWVVVPFIFCLVTPVL
jgi:hypothetical protein